MKALGILAALGLVLVAAGCGGSSSNVTGPSIAPATVFRLIHVRPSGPVTAGKPVRVSFQIEQPDGTPMTKFKTGPGPHTGVHLILVRRDLAALIHEHPPIAADGTIAKDVTFPSPGPYRMVVDVYPASGQQTNFQLFGSVMVSGAYKPQPLPAVTATDTTGGYRFTLHGAEHLKAIEASLVTVDVTGPAGPASFTPWFGALAHAIFFRQGSLDYFHTHVCAAGVSGCTSVLGPTKVTGTSTAPGKLRVGILVPAPGTWRLFLQCRIDGTVLTAPFTLHVRS
ncbi:MAG TPA: hypothetical protein VGM80_06825 [Gaiellaceae bacterium]